MNINDKSSTETVSPWKGDEDEFRVFLSYKDSVHKETIKVADTLKFYGVDCFVAKYAPTPGKWPDQIEEALSSMDAFVPLITDNYHDSFWTNQEIGFAIARNIPIIPIKLEDKNPEGFIYTNTAISCDWDSASFRILEELLKCQKYSKMVDALIKALEQNCTKFDQVSFIKYLLENVQKISDQQAKNLILAFYQNDQVACCFDFCGTDPQKYGEPLKLLLQKLTHEIYEIKDCGIVNGTYGAKRIQKVK